MLSAHDWWHLLDRPSLLLRTEILRFEMGDALGFTLTIAGTFLAATGYVLQKWAHIESEKATEKLPSWKYWKWSAGLVCMVISATLVVLASPYLDQSKSAPLGAATLVFNMLLATILLKERFTVLAGVSTIVIVVGTVVAVSSSETTSKDLNFEEILALLGGDALVAIYSAGMAVLMPGAALWIERLTRSNEKVWSTRQRTMLGVLAPALGGWCNGYTSYAAKVLTTVIVKGQLGPALAGSVGSGAFWAYLLLVILAVVGQVRYLNKGLAYFSALSTVPVFQAAIIIANSLAGIVYFRDLRGPGAEPWRLAVFFVGAAMCVSGIILLRLQRPAPTPGAPALQEWDKGATQVASPLAVAQPGGDSMVIPLAPKADGAGLSSSSSTFSTSINATSASSTASAVSPAIKGLGADSGSAQGAATASGPFPVPAFLNLERDPATVADWLNLEVSSALRIARKRYG